jgi:hypothetical protein
VTPNERAEIQRRVRILAELQITDGFKLFDQMMKQSAAQMQSNVFAAKDAHTQAQAVGALRALTQISEWVDRQLTIDRMELSESSSES